MKANYLSFVTLSLLGLASAQGLAVESYNRKPLIDSRALQRLVTRRALVRHARKLQSFAELSPRQPNRAFGSPGHNATIEYIKELLDKTGYYDTRYESLPYTYSESSSNFRIESGESVEALPTKSFFYAPSGNVSAPLVALEEFGCLPEHFPESVAGKIVLIERGECIYGIKVALAGAANAAGVIVYNDVDAEFAGGSLGGVSRPEGPYVPVGSISGLNGRRLKARLDYGEEILGHLDAFGLVEERWSSNLIAESKYGDKNNVVFSGSHADSVPAGPGINDDGSGTIANLEVALQLTNFRLNNAVRFAWWTAEEFGLVGSTYHIRNASPSYLSKIALYLNFDMIASPNSGFFIYDGDGDTFQRPGPEGSAQIERLYEDYYRERKLKSAPSNFTGRSDYGPFLEVGIPAGGVFTGHEGVKTKEGVEWWGGQEGVVYDQCYHAVCDTFDNLRLETFEVNAQAVAHGIATYSRSLRGFPFPRPEFRIAQDQPLHVETLSYEERRHYGCNHHHEVSWE
ncbi:leucine aminopeptidase 1 [Coprinopsis cinerea okayama7|uniref:Peptide hydrolase n=1 Tax=Coprinopsis cinerea (strain Okayama-7 / 130 / ATCC MYA-4618 / FGSC 9003) TaxID=240176 RepID=A8PFK7_COPC7|nr:leucine aminopeptidase 1 [Coprinopsis cinerea okayama7\|eukprot:XP_001841084.1 leucine aminopeptidase 1 [Coprinopsis cinerea okayama7\